MPHGRTDNGGANDRGAWHDVPDDIAWAWSTLGQRYKSITEKHPTALSNNSARHLGTLGTGNHFIEVCLDESDNVWAMLHSGSRGCGNRIGTYFIPECPLKTPVKRATAEPAKTPAGSRSPHQPGS